MSASQSGWIEALLRWRDQWLIDPGFQRWSLRLPLTRWIARRRMRALFDLCSGFVYSQVLLACTRLDLFKRLAQAPQSTAQLAVDLQLPQPAVERLLEASESLGLVERRRHQRYGLGPLGAAMLGNPSVAMMIEHHGALYEDLRDPVSLLRGQRERTALGQFWAYSRHAGGAEIDSEATRAYSDLMAASQALVAEQVLTAYSMRRHRSLLDLGGGTGAFAAAALQRWPRLKACVFDLPSVAERAAGRLRQLGHADRSSVCGGSFLADPLPTGHDLITLIRILHDHDDAAVLAILRAARAAISPQGVVLIAEPMLDTRGAEPVAAAYFGFYLMAMGQGRARSRAVIEAMLREAGFSGARMHGTSAPLIASVITARPDPGVNSS